VSQAGSRGPAAPNAAERARTIAARRGHCSLLPAAEFALKVVPLLHHVHHDGTATVLLADRHPLVSAAWQAPRGELTVVLELADPAPVRLREPVRGLLWVTGWLRALDRDGARAAAVALAEQQPDPRVLDVGHGATVLRLSPVSLVIADAEGTRSMLPSEFAAADPDPFYLLEDNWLRHLDLTHRDVVGLLARHVPDALRGGHIRPLGLDRFGLRLRVESTREDHDVRLAFSRPVSTTQEVAAELRRLVGCPFLAGVRDTWD
jgi:hypothetical protein